jgi:hypothetical protein
LVSEAGKELLFSVVTFSPYGLFCCWFVAGKEPPHDCGGHSYPY